MATIEYRLSSQIPLTLQFTDDDNVPVTDLAYRMSVGVGDACFYVVGVEDGDNFDFDLSALDLLPRLYPATIQIDDGSGWEHYYDFNLSVIGGC